MNLKKSSKNSDVYSIYPILFCTYISIFAQDQLIESSLANKVQTVEAVAYIGKTIVSGISNLIPDDEKQLKEEELREKVKALQAEQNLKQCLVENAFHERKEGEFPAICHELASAFIAAAGMKKYNNLKEEFNITVENMPTPVVKELTVKEEIPHEAYSLTEKIFIGTAVVVGVGVVAFFAAPVVVPGSIIAAKATATTAAIKTTAATVGAKAVSVGGAGVAIIVKATKDFNDLSPEDKLKATAKAMKQSEQVMIVSPYGYERIELNLKTLQTPLKEQIEEAHFKNPRN